jgi:hypothetical protein
MSSSSKETKQTQESQTRPWAEAMPLVNTLLGQYGNLNTGVTSDQSAALAGLKNSLSNLPNFGGTAAESLGKLFSSDSTGQVGMLNSAYDTLKTNLGATASGANLNPYETPGFADALKFASDDALNRVKSTYAASGRDPSGAGSFAGSAARGILQGTAPTIANQYNTNFSNMATANRDLLSGAGSTASGINNLRQSDFANFLSGITGAAALPGLYGGPAQAQLLAANTAYSQPYQNLAQLLQPSVALAGLGSNSSGSGTSTQTNNPSWLDTISGGLKLGGQISSGIGSLFALSDERAKENKVKVGELHDGTPVWSFNYIGDDEPRMGVMAQEVEKRDPAAVVDVGGLKVVNYDRVTRRAARVGALLEAA